MTLNIKEAYEFIFHKTKDCKVVLILRGIPGSGKSFLKEHIVNSAKDKNLTWLCCSADDYFLTKSGYKHVPADINKAHMECESKFKDAISANVTLVIVDNTHTQKWEYEKYINQGEAAKYKIILMELDCPNVAFAHYFASRNQHNVPHSKVLLMYNRWEVDRTAVLVTSQYSSKIVSKFRDQFSAVYIGVFLTPKSKSELLKKVKPLYDLLDDLHVTLQFHPSISEIKKIEFGKKVSLTVIGIVKDDNAQIAVIKMNDDQLICANKIPHITISITQAVRPVYSNELLEKKVPESMDSIQLEGITGFFVKFADRSCCAITRPQKRILKQRKL